MTVAANQLVHRTTSAASPCVFTNLNPAASFKLLEVKVTLDAAGGAAENFTITQDATAGAGYDNLLFAQDMTLTQYIRWIPEDDTGRFMSGDQLVFAYANTNARSVCVEVIYRTGEA